jgi:hypothetical protein
MIEMYVKLISKEHEWFDAGTEVFEAYMDGHNAKHKPLKRMTVEEYKIWEKAGHIIAYGTRSGQLSVELCPIEEFEIVYTEEQT